MKIIENEFFLVPMIFFVNFDFKNECKNEFQDNNEKSWRLFENKARPKNRF